MFWAIGDIHGEVRLLRGILEGMREAGLRDDDILVFLGDYIDRGEDSSGVIEELLRVRAERPNTIFLRGNHEQMLLDAARDPDPHTYEGEDWFRDGQATLLWLQNGGDKALDSWGVDDASRWKTFLPAAHWEFIEATRMECRTDDYHFVHAGILPPGMGWEGEAYGLDPRLWIREPFLSSDHDFGRLVVFGHTPQESGRPLLMPNKLCVDTAAVFGGPLTAVELPDPRPADLTSLRVLQVAPE